MPWPSDPNHERAVKGQFPYPLSESLSFNTICDSSYGYTVILMRMRTVALQREITSGVVSVEFGPQDVLGRLRIAFTILQKHPQRTIKHFKPAFL